MKRSLISHGGIVHTISAAMWKRTNADIAMRSAFHRQAKGSLPSFAFN